MSKDYRYRDKKWLKDQYVNKKRFQYEIAEETGVAQTTISSWLRRFDIETRNASHLNEFGSVDDYFEDFFDGTMLGDGWLQRRSSESARYAISQKHKSYCKWIKSLMAKYGIEQSGQIYSREKQDSVTFRYTTRDYVDFEKEYSRWYQKEKIIPKDVRITPISVRHWFIEDGGFSRKEWGTREVYFCTNGFKDNDVKYLAARLAENLDVGKDMIKVYNHKGPIIRFAEPKVVKSFFAFVSPLPAPLRNDYGYKWPNNEGVAVA